MLENSGLALNDTKGFNIKQSSDAVSFQWWNRAAQSYIAYKKLTKGQEFFITSIMIMQVMKKRHKSYCIDYINYQDHV